MSAVEVKVPDIGDFKDVPVIDIMVKPGDSVKAEDSLVSLESDKATMDVPAPFAGTVKDIKVKLGDKVSEGSLILTLDSDAPAVSAAAEHHKAAVSAPPAPTSAPAGVAEVRVPGIGDFKDVPVIEVLVKPGDTVKAEDALVTLESDKATMDVPAPLGGVVRDLAVKVGDKVSEGALVLTLVTDAAQAAAAPSPQPAVSTPASIGRGSAATSTQTSPLSPGEGPGVRVDETGFAIAYASPGVRKMARDLGVNLGSVKGSGNKGRIVKEDVEAAAKGGPSPAAAGRAECSDGRRHRPPAVAESRLREIRPGRGQAAFADQEDLGREPAPQLGDDPARHQSRRRRHHRARAVSRAAQQGDREGRSQGLDAGVHDQGRGRSAQEVPGVQQLDRR